MSQGVVRRIRGRGDLDFRFYIVDTDIVNAFALPGGYVYVTRQLLGLMGSEGELAFVLGHEVGHITGDHSAARRRSASWRPMCRARRSAI